MEIKTVLFRAVIVGEGIVNFDSNDQKYLWNRQRDIERCYHNNVMFGKGRYHKESFENKEGQLENCLVKTPVISADCIRHTMYEDCQSIHLPNVIHDDNKLLNVVASLPLIERGYLYCREDKSTWKRKSSLYFGYAKCVSDSTPALETYSNSQPKIKNKDEEKESSDTSFFKKEVLGDTKYQLTGGIDVGELSFISISDIHDRLSFDSDYAENFRNILSSRIGSEIPNPCFFDKKNDVYGIPEYGILLTQEQTKILVLDILTRLARFNLHRTSSGWAKMNNIQIKLVVDPLKDVSENEEGWVTFFDSNGINKNIFDNSFFEEGYVKVDLQEKAKEDILKYKNKYGYEKKSKKSKKSSNSTEDSDE